MVTTIDKKTKTILLETDYDFSEFKIELFQNYFHCNFIKINMNQWAVSCFGIYLADESAIHQKSKLQR